MNKVEGLWDWSVRTPMGEQRAKMDLKRAGDNYGGSIKGAFGDVEFTDATVDNDMLKFSVAVKQPMPLTLECAFTIAGDTFTGTVNAVGVGAFSANGQRVS